MNKLENVLKDLQLLYRVIKWGRFRRSIAFAIDYLIRINELIEDIDETIKRANDVCEYTAFPETAGYTKGLEMVKEKFE